jgi:hypothetical protein
MMLTEKKISIDEELVKSQLGEVVMETVEEIIIASLKKRGCMAFYSSFPTNAWVLSNTC